jgi:signal transduction histidine kinase
MAFQDKLRLYLEGLLTERPEAPQSWFNPDLRLHRQHLLRGLQRLETAGTSKRGLETLLERWSVRIDSFATQMGVGLVNGLAHGAPPQDVTDLINVALSRMLGVETSTGSFVKDTELDRLSWQIDCTFDRDELLVPQYALEIRAVRRFGERRQLTPLGRIALELPERDVVRWLLSAEAIQSRGASDEWRLPRSAAAELRKLPYGARSYDEESSFPAAYRTMVRLSQMGVLILEEVRDDETGEPLGDRYEVAREALPILDELASGQDTPFAVLIAALLSDETNVTVEPHRPSQAPRNLETAAIATTRHARMVAHEIRNALVPVQGALDRLYRDTERQGAESLLTGHRDSIDRGIERVFRFIKDMMEVAERGAEPPNAFEIGPTIQDAIAVIATELGRGITFDPIRKLPPVTGHRHRFTMAIINLLRNAVQTIADGPADIRIFADLDDGGGVVCVRVEDNGPGVPVEHRSAIFEHGFSLRPGGTGQGLALVREVVQSEMGGHATCEDSSLGGACFVLKLPVTGRKAG